MAKITPLDVSIEMWALLAKTGLTKTGYFKRFHPELVATDKVPPYMCWLCNEYVSVKCVGCPIAALEGRRGGCQELGIKYSECRTVTERKAAARAYVTYLVDLRDTAASKHLAS